MTCTLKGQVDTLKTFLRRLGRPAIATTGFKDFALGCLPLGDFPLSDSMYVNF